MSKKHISAILSGLVFLSSASAAYADTSISVVRTEITRAASSTVANSAVNEETVKISKEQAMEIVKKTMKEFFGTDIDDKKYQVQYELHSDYEVPGTNQWQISFNKTDGDRGEYYSLDLNADNGKFVSFRTSEFYHGQPETAIAVITREQAKATADELLKRINPSEMNQVEYMDDTRFNNLYPSAQPARYGFQYVRKVNGVKFNQNYITVEVNGLTGKVVGYSCRWYDDIKIPGMDGIISEQKARDLFDQKSGMELKYISKRDRNNYDYSLRSAVLVYVPSQMEGSMLDAKEGVILDWRTEKSEERKSKDLTEAEKNTLFSGLRSSVKPEKEIDNLKATEIMNQAVKENMGEGYEIQSVRYEEGNVSWTGNADKIWTAQFMKKERPVYGPMPGGSISIDASTGMLVSMYNHSMYEMSEKTPDDSKKLTWDSAYMKAIDTMIKYYPDKVKSVRTLQTYMKDSMRINGKEMGERYYNFSFGRLVDGIPYQDNYITLRIDVYTGAVSEIRCQWNDKLQFAPKSGIISAEEAKGIFYKYHSPVLSYIYKGMGKEAVTAEKAANLVYTLQSTDRDTAPTIYNIDAVTGKRIDAFGQEPVKKENTFEAKIKGHWAEKQLTILAYQGILDTDSFSADGEISLLKALKMLVYAKGYEPYMAREIPAVKFTNIPQDDPDLNFIKLAVKYGLIENKEGVLEKEEKVTREKMAQLLVKLLNYEKLAKAREIFTLPYDDANKISSDLYSYVAIAKGLGIFEDNGSSFRPKENTTEIEFAMAIYKTLGSIRSSR